jgi:hypothetical protein
LTVCSVAFLIQFIFIWVEFIKDQTGVGTGKEEAISDKKQLPCLTICPLPAFKDIEKGHLLDINMVQYYKTFSLTLLGNCNIDFLIFRHCFLIISLKMSEV